jgi:hypothetical protein
MGSSSHAAPLLPFISAPKGSGFRAIAQQFFGTRNGSMPHPRHVGPLSAPAKPKHLHEIEGFDPEGEDDQVGETPGIPKDCYYIADLASRIQPDRVRPLIRPTWMRR